MAVSLPLDRTAAIDRYFIEHRAKLLDLASYLDRIERATPREGGDGFDFRHDALLRAIAILTDGKPERARRVLEHFSDPSTEPIAKASVKGATGAHQGTRPSPGPRGGA